MSTHRTILFAFAISAMIALGCNRQSTNTIINEGETGSTVISADTTIVETGSVAELADSVVERAEHVVTGRDIVETQVGSAEYTPVGYYDNFVKLEVNKEEGYEVRRVNELVFANSAATDTLLTALLEMSPVKKDESITIYVYPFDRIHLEKTRIHGPRMVVEGEEDFEYYFGYVQIDTFFIEVTGRKDYYGEEVKTSAERMFKNTGHTNDYKYKYYSPYPGGGKLYVFEITDSTVTTLHKGISE